MNALSQFQQKMNARIEPLWVWLEAKPTRERYMVIFCGVFVLFGLVFLLLWKAHDLADRQQKRLNQLKDLTVWMQTNAATLQPGDAVSLSLQDKVQRAAQQQGISVAMQGSDEQVMLSAEHPNYAVLANFLTQLAQMGLSIEKMEMVSASNQLKLTATVR